MPRLVAVQESSAVVMVVDTHRGAQILLMQAQMQQVMEVGGVVQQLAVQVPLMLLEAPENVELLLYATGCVCHHH